MGVLTFVISTCLLFCSTQSSKGSPLRSIDEINRIPDPSSSGIQPFEISGQVLSSFHDGRFNVITITDRHSSLAFANTTTNSCRCGNIIHIRGFANRNPQLGDKGLFADFLEVTGDEPLPETGEAVIPISHQHPFGQLQGVISHVVRDEMDSNYNWIVLRTPYGDLCASASETEYPYERLTRLIDAEVLLRGSVLRGLKLRKPGAFYLSLFGKDGIQLLLPPPADPFAAPLISPQPSLHRQRAAGTVVAIGHDMVLVQLHDGRFLQASKPIAESDLHPGDDITAVGFVTTDAYALLLSGSILRRNGNKGIGSAKAQDISPSVLFSCHHNLSGINVALHGKSIRVRGILSESQDTLVNKKTLRLELGHHTVDIDTHPIPSKLLEMLEPGTTIEVAGICLAQFNTGIATSVFPSFDRFLIVPRSAEDLVILARPPWWTATKLLLVIAFLFIIILIVLIWNRSLHTLSERRGRALSLALTARVRAESRTQERTRLALELHDSISQSLTGVALQIDAATTTVQIDADRRNAYLTTAKHLLASCRKALQDCLWDLRSRTFEEKNLTEAISRTLAPFLNKCTILVRFNVPSETLSESAMHAILNIVRELTANAIRHGHASHIRIAGELRDGCVRFSVADDGIGFDVTHAPGPHDGHFGLQGIHERVNDFGGSVDLTSSPGKGTKTIVTLIVKATGISDEKEDIQ